MRLTPELFEQLTGVKESALEQLQPKRKNDLRAAPRLPWAFRSSACRIDGDRLGSPIQIQILDVSVIGIGLIHALQDTLGETFVVAIKPRRNGGPIAFHCQMANCQSAGPTRIRVGATFVRVGTEQEMRHCIGLDASAGYPRAHVLSASPKPASATPQLQVLATPSCRSAGGIRRA